MKNYLIGLFVILIIFIIYLMNFSQSSFFTYLKLKNEVKEKNEILDSYKKKSEELKKNIKKLNSNDLQYIEEIAREIGTSTYTLLTGIHGRTQRIPI